MAAAATFKSDTNQTIQRLALEHCVPMTGATEQGVCTLLHFQSAVFVKLQ